jgi:hypothetical protein
VTRLAVKEETVRRLRALLASNTGKLSDILEVERELARVVTEMEQLKGEQRYYDQRVAISTISVNLLEIGAIAPVGVTSGIARAFRESLQALGTSASWLVYLITFLVPWLILAVAVRWVALRVRDARRAPSAG